ncbi:MAG: alpha-galactosidase [Planctomycetota bacterium]
MTRNTAKKQGNAAQAWRVTPVEMQDAREWRDGMLAVVGRGAHRPEVVFIRQGWGDLHINMAVDESPLCLAGKVYASGLGTHSESDLRLRVPAGSRRLTGLCGINDSELTRGLAADQTFSIAAGGRVLWTRGPRGVASPAARFDIALAGRRELLLKVRGPIARAHVDWVNLKVDSRTVSAPGTGVQGGIFGFRYGGKASADLLPAWRLKVARSAERNGMVRHTLTRTDPKTGLAVICEVREYRDFPVVEWVVRLKNTSKRTSPLIEELRSMDLSFRCGAFPYLNHWTGDYCSPDGYEQFRVALAHGEEYRFASMGGRGTNRAFPYYNLEWPDTGRGVIAVVGWAGQWTSRFEGDLNLRGAVRISAGQELTHFKLLPGEEARTPSALLMFYRGDMERSQNLWRRFFRGHVMPKPAGKPMTPHLGCAATDEGEEFTAATTDNQLRFIGKFAAQRIPFDIWWIDAGWYPCYSEREKRKTWRRTGTWRPDPDRFPNGLKPISDCAKKNGAGLLLWFEPERVRAGTALDLEHPEWLFKAGNSEDRLLNLGDPACRQWLTDHVCRLIRDNGIKVYRQDFNFEPLRYWRDNDAPDRQGMNENLHVQGYLKYWDDLLIRNPELWIDSCASGGQRNDLDTMRRSVPLHYTDYGYGNHPVKLAFHNALFQWLVYFKEVTLSWDLEGEARFDHNTDRYALHCGFGPMMMPCIDIRRDDYDFAMIRTMLGIWRQAAELMLDGDYHPLTPIHSSSKKWVARQFNRPETGRGFIQAIRLPQAPEDRIVVHPKGLRPEGLYVFENPETGAKRERRGAAVMRGGFEFAQPKRRGAIWFYRT